MFLSVLAILIHATLSADPTTLDPSVLAGITFDEVTQETFGGTKTYDIGWVKIFYCNQGSSYDTEGDFSKHYIGSTSSSDSSRFAELAPYAISFKVVPDPDTNPTEDEITNYAFYGSVCSGAMDNVNDFGQLTTNIITIRYYAATWDGFMRLAASCTPSWHTLDKVIYEACGNADGVHIGDFGTHESCFFSGGDQREEPTGKIAFYLGFDASKINVCEYWTKEDAFYELNPCGDTCADTGNVCTENVCINGECVIQNKVAGASCSDNDACNGDEACDGNGTCQAGIAIICDDGDQCTEDICDKNTGLCTGELKDCGLGLACDGSTGGCNADCDVFDINEYEESCSGITNGGLEARIEALEEMMNPDSNAASSTIVDSNFVNKAVLIMLLLAINIVLLMISLCCYIKNGSKSVKYEQVKVYSAEVEDLKPIDDLDINA